MNSKKAKLRELRDQLTQQNKVTGKLPQEEESTDKTESFDEGSDDEKSEEEEALASLTATSKDIPATRPRRGRKRTMHK